MYGVLMAEALKCEHAIRTSLVMPTQNTSTFCAFVILASWTVAAASRFAVPSVISTASFVTFGLLLLNSCVRATRNACNIHSCHVPTASTDARQTFTSHVQYLFSLPNALLYHTTLSRERTILLPTPGSEHRALYCRRAVCVSPSVRLSHAGSVQFSSVRQD